MNKTAPILKWAGGKRQLLTQILPHIPNDYNRYFEPFLGAGAVLFELQPKRATINDTNAELINVYQVIKDNPDELIKLLKEYDKQHCKDFYYNIRDIDRDSVKFQKLSEVEKASRTIYLNRTCYNGLYRVNSAGCFNTPMGHNTTIQIVNENGIRAINEYLNKYEIRILNTDYREALKRVRKTDFVFLDPPYYPTGKDYFIRYDSSLFGIENQEELKKMCDRLTNRGIRFIQTNSCCDGIKKLYEEYRIIEVDVRRSINTKVEGRKDKEVIILNY